jgi:hypothetical protein
MHLILGGLTSELVCCSFIDCCFECNLLLWGLVVIKLLFSKLLSMIIMSICHLLSNKVESNSLLIQLCNEYSQCNCMIPTFGLLVVEDEI